MVGTIKPYRFVVGVQERNRMSPPSGLDFAVISPRKLTASQVEHIALDVSKREGLNGIRTIGPGCIHCLKAMSVAPASYGIFVPRRPQILRETGGRVIVYGLCKDCLHPNAVTIEHNIIGAHMLMTRSHRANATA